MNPGHGHRQSLCNGVQVWLAASWQLEGEERDNILTVHVVLHQIGSGGLSGCFSLRNNGLWEPRARAGKFLVCPHSSSETWLSTKNHRGVCLKLNSWALSAKMLVARLEPWESVLGQSHPGNCLQVTLRPPQAALASAAAIPGDRG